MKATAGIRAMDMDRRTCKIGTQTYHFDNELLAAVNWWCWAIPAHRSSRNCSSESI